MTADDALVFYMCGFVATCGVGSGAFLTVALVRWAKSYLST